MPTHPPPGFSASGSRTIQIPYNQANSPPPETMSVTMTTPPQLDDLLAAPCDSSRERATWVYGALRYFLDIAVASRTERVLQFAAEIDAHPRGREIRDILWDFWS